MDTTALAEGDLYVICYASVGSAQVDFQNER